MNEITVIPQHVGLILSERNQVKYAFRPLGLVPIEQFGLTTKKGRQAPESKVLTAL